MFDDQDEAEIQRLTERSRKMTRRAAALKAGKFLTFTTPAIAAFVVPRQALGQTGSGFDLGNGGNNGNGNGMGNMGMGNNGIGNMGAMNMGMM